MKKNYKKIFAEENKKLINPPKKLIHTIVMVGVPLLIVVIVRCILGIIKPFAYTTRLFDTCNLLVFYLLLSIFIMRAIISIVRDNREKLINIAKEFAATILLNDIIATLNTEFTCSSRYMFENKIKKVLRENATFSNGEFVCNYFSLDYKDEGERVFFSKDNITYYLTSWQYAEDMPFIFTFDKVVDKEVISTEMHLELEKA